jgi:UDP-glucose 4-epimerase
VTGGAGYIGSHTVECLLESNRRVVVLDNLSTGHIEVVNLFDRLYGPDLFAFENVDLANLNDVRKVVEAHSPTGVIDFAARSLVGESQREPRLYFETNVIGFYNLVTACDGIPIVKSTTAATYGDPLAEDLPLREDYQDIVVGEGRFTESQLMPGSAGFDEILNWYARDVANKNADLALTEDDHRKLMIPTNVYGLTKLLDEIILQKLWETSRAPYTALRYFNVAGASDTGLIGEDHDLETHLIPITFQAALGQRESVTVFGSDYDTPDGTAIRDYVSVGDLADAHIRCLDRVTEQPDACTYNLGTRSGYSVREILDTATQVSGQAIPQLDGERRSGDPERLIADAGKIQADLGWQATSTLAETMGRAWRWHRNNPAGYRAIQEERFSPFWRRWITFASSRGSRPWEGDVESHAQTVHGPEHDPACYLCPGNTRTSGAVNPEYDYTFAFPNDFPSMTEDAYIPDQPSGSYAARPSTGVCEVIVYGRHHSQRMSTMPTVQIEHVIDAWTEVYDRLGQRLDVDYVMVFENRGAVMGNSQLHPHGQVYAYGSIPDLMVRDQLVAFRDANFVSEALDAELVDGRRILFENNGFCAFVPFASWMPYDICILPRRPIRSFSETSPSERGELAKLLKVVLAGMDNLFGRPYQYSMALIQAPTDGSDAPFHAQIHITSLLRGPDIRKHVVGTDIFGRSVNPSDPNVSAAEIRRAIARA